jgi:hypothetical protein
MKMLRYEVLPGLPAHGAMAIAFRAGEWRGAWSGHSEGLVVRFDPYKGESWVGNFQPGFRRSGSGSDSGGWEGVLEHPNGQHLIIIARGQGYVVDPETRRLVLTFSGNLQHVIPLPEFDAILFCDGLGFEAIKARGLWWRSPRISWDEIRNINVDGGVLRGEASTPTADGNRWAPFTLDLMTGRCEDGVYEHEMRGAMPFRP